MQNQKTYVFISIFTLTLLLAACGSTDSETTETTDADESTDNNDDERVSIDVAYHSQPPTLDPTMSTSTTVRDITRHIYEPLVTTNENYEVEPMLAESYEESDDGRNLTFHLREGVFFHNGEEMTADDVVASLDKWRNTSVYGIASFSEAEFTAEDDYTVTINLPERSQVAVFDLAHSNQFAAIMPEEMVAEADANGVPEHIGTGPFQLEEWNQDHYIHFSKFEDYEPLTQEPSGLSGEKSPIANDLYFHFVTDASTRVAGIQSGEYDVATNMPYDNAEQLENHPDVDIHVNEEGLQALVFNNAEGFFQDQNARKAVNAALDHEAILLSAYNHEDYYGLTHTLMSEDQVEWYTETGKDQYNQNDLEKAEQFLEEADYDGEEIVILTSREFEDHYNSAVVVQQQLEQLGLNVELEVYDWSTLLERRDNPEQFDIFISNYSVDTSPTQYIFLDSRTDYTGWTDSPEIDQYLDEIVAASSQEEAKEWYGELQEEVWDYLPVIKLGDSKKITATRSEVEGFDYQRGVVLWNIGK